MIQMKAIDGQFLDVVLFTVQYKVVLTFESVYDTLKCDHSNESHWAVLSSGAAYFARVFLLDSVDEILQ